MRVAQRPGQPTTAFRDALDLLPIRLDPDTDRQAWGITLRLASRHRLTLSDATYLELAMRRGLPLATLDTDLRAAARCGHSCAKVWRIMGVMG